MADAMLPSARPTATKKDAKREQRRLLVNLLLMSMVAGGSTKDGLGIGHVFRTIVRLTLIGGVIGTLFLVIENIILNLTGLETGVEALDNLISGGLTLVVGYLLLSDVLETIVPGIKKKLGF